MRTKEFEWSTKEFVQHWYEYDIDQLIDRFCDYVDDHKIDVGGLPIPPSDTTDTLSFYEQYFEERFGPTNYCRKESHLIKSIDFLYRDLTKTVWTLSEDWWYDKYNDVFSLPTDKLFTHILEDLFSEGERVSDTTKEVLDRMSTLQLSESERRNYLIENLSIEDIDRYFHCIGSDLTSDFPMDLSDRICETLGIEDDESFFYQCEERLKDTDYKLVGGF